MPATRSSVQPIGPVAEVQFPILYPDDQVVRTAFRGVAARVLPATELAGGDVDLAPGWVRLTVQGLYPEALPVGLFDAIDLSVFFPSPNPAEPDQLLRYWAWAHRESPVVNRGAGS